MDEMIELVQLLEEENEFMEKEDDETEKEEETESDKEEEEDKENEYKKTEQGVEKNIAFTKKSILLIN
jgi:hypothetical protein